MRDIEHELGVYTDIYPTGEKDKYGQKICHARCKICDTIVYKPIDRIRRHNSVCNHVDNSIMPDIGIYTNIHESGRRTNSGHKLYYATCSICGIVVEKAWSDIKESNKVCRHKTLKSSVDGYKVNDMPTGWMNESEFNMRIYYTWKAMIERTTKKYWNKYPTYVGTTVDESWRKLSNFVNDIKTLDGYETWANSPHQRMMLDKDTLVNGNKHYSKETCRFITHAESNKDVARRHPDKSRKAANVVKELYGKKIKAINVVTNESIVFNSQKEAAKELDVLASHIWMILSQDEKYKSHKTTKSPDGTKWTFEVI